MRYAQIEKEMLAIVFGCVKFHQNILGKTITVQTDHEPLESIMNKYSFHKKLGLRLATNNSWCLLNKPLNISKADTKIFIGGFQTKMRGAGFIPFLG